MKLRKNTLKPSLILIFLFLYTFCFSQDKNTEIFDLNKEYTQSFIDSLFKNSSKDSQSLKLYKSILESNDKLLGWPHYYGVEASLYFREGKIDSVIYSTNKGIESYVNAKVKRDFDEEALILLYLIKGRGLVDQRKYNNSIKSYQSALDLTKRYEYKWKSFIVEGIAMNHYRLGNDSIALTYYNQISNDTLYMGIPRSAISNHINRGLLNQALEQPELAKNIFLEGIEISKKTEFHDFIYGIYYNLGYLQYKKSNIDSTKYYFRKGIEAFSLYDSVNNDTLLFKNSNAYINIIDGKVNDGIEEFKEVIGAIDKIEELDKIDKSLYDFAYENLVEVYTTLNDYESLSKIHKKQINFLARLQENQIKEELQRLEISFQAKEKDASILQLEENKIQQEIIINQQRYLGFGLGGLLITFFVLGYILWRQRKLRNQYQLENLEQRLLRLQMNPHFVFNALNTVCGMVEKKSNKTISYINKLATLFRLILTNSREEFVGLDEEILTLDSYLELQSNFSNTFDFKIEIDDKINVEEIIIPPMLLQPFVENAIQHGFVNIKNKAKIDILIEKEPNTELLKFLIIDNGIGHSKSLSLKEQSNISHKSLSENIVKERLTLLKKKFKVNCRLNIIINKPTGTCVELYLPFFVD